MLYTKMPAPNITSSAQPQPTNTITTTEHTNMDTRVANRSVKHEFVPCLKNKRRVS